MMRFGSLFTGIGGFDLGFEHAGMECAWQVEIEPNCQRLLESKWPDVKRKGDVRKVGKRNLDPVDIICGGFPCQDVSVAGRRAGLAGARSGLWHEFHRVVAELRPRWVVVENVPGLLSSNEGRDFAVILRGLVECGYGVAWRILDAQYFGVAQRRRRVFLVGHIGDGRAAQVLFESESLSRDTAPRREAGERTPALVASGVGAGRTGNERTEIDFLIAGTMRCNGDAHSGFQLSDGLVANPLGAGQNGPRYDLDNDTYLVQAFAWQQGDDSKFNDNGRGRSYIARAGDYAGALSETRVDAVAIRLSNTSANGWGVGGRTSQSMGGSSDAIAFQQNQRNEVRELTIAGAINSEAGMHNQNFLHQEMGVRRLTPLECERLQGFPDGWTVGFADSVRYRMLGNAVCANQAEWIGRRILQYGN